MASASARRGYSWEKALVDWFKAHGWPNCDRQVKHGINDTGDIAGIPHFVIEAKSAASWRPESWVVEALVEQAHARVPFSFVAVKRKGTTDAGKGYALLRVEDMNTIMLDLVSARAELIDLRRRVAARERKASR